MTNELVIASTTDEQSKIDAAVQNDESAARGRAPQPEEQNLDGSGVVSFEHPRSERTMLQERLAAAEAELQELTYPEDENETVTTNEAAKAEQGATKTETQEETPAVPDTEVDRYWADVRRMALLDARRDARAKLGLPVDDYYSEKMREHLSTPAQKLNQARQQLATKFQERVNAIKPGNFDELLQAATADTSAPPITGEIVDALLGLPNGAEAYVYLLQNPKEWRRIGSSPAAVAEIGALTARLGAPARRAISNAPEPIRPVGGSPTRSAKSPDEMSFAEYRAWRDRQSKSNFRR